MHIMYFTEQPMSTYPEDKISEVVPVGGGQAQKVTSLMFSNRWFNPVDGSRLYNERLEEYQYVDEVGGYDGIMLNEHHTAPFCMSPRINIVGAMLATLTKRVKLVMLGNPIPIWDSPVHLAEETSIIDMVSNGRLVPGLVRGGGVESIEANTNPFYNRERFEEGHDLLVKAWTQDGPFRWEGKHYQFRVVNPWARPLQKPHPRIWIPGVASAETVMWAAEHRYPYIGLTTNFEQSAKIKEIYREVARGIGYEAGPEQFGILFQCHVADTEEKAERNAEQFLWMRGEFTGLQHPVWAHPSGYGPAKRRAALIDVRAGRRPNYRQASLEERRADKTFVGGTPDTVVKQLKIIMEKNPSSIMILWSVDGRIDHKDTMDCIRLTSQYVLPEVREYAKKLGLNDPFELNTPVSLAYTPKDQLRPG